MKEMILPFEELTDIIEDKVVLEYWNHIWVFIIYDISDDLWIVVVSTS